MAENGISKKSGGGETPHVGDQKGKVAVDSSAVAVCPREKIIDNAQIRPGLSIVGLSSCGQASYETFENSGIGSNGLTSARHELLSSHYREHYPETFDPQTDRQFLYCGPHRMADPLPGSTLSVGEALLSPTRTYLPVVKKIVEELNEEVLGLVHCSGGGQTKCLRFGTRVHHIKNNLFEVPALFKEIQRVSGTTDEEMHQVYNMGHRLEVFCPPEAASKVIALAQSFDIDAQVIGKTEESQKSDGNNHLTIQRDDLTLQYG
jgi:phosphoribosylformylglycinamidine cyclo-ligase